jgi:hypothetical protein
VLRFDVPSRGQVPDDAEHRAYVTNHESIPWLCRNQWRDDQFIVERQVTDSGYLHFPWRSPSKGTLMLSTGTLVERADPYLLSLELARGTLHRVRQQLSAWEDQGLRDAAAASASVREAVNLFARAVACQNSRGEAHDLAVRSIDASLDAGQRLVERYVNQVLELRHQSAGQLTTAFGVTLGRRLPSDDEAELLREAFSAVTVPMRWRDIEVAAGEFQWDEADAQMEWCRKAGLKVTAGPLLTLNALTIPDWVYLWEGDRDGVASLVGQYVKQVVQRFKKRVHLWHCVANRSVTEQLGLTEEDHLKIIISAIESLRQVDADAPLLVSFDQPWGEHMSRRDVEFAPWFFADALVRSDLKVSALGLEFNIGYTRGCTMRDPVDISRRLETWSTFGVPIIAFLTVPSQSGVDPAATEDIEPTHQADHICDKWQANWAVDLVQLLLAKRFVQGIFWNQWSDAEPHIYPFAGLLDGDGWPKEALYRLTEMRHKHMV